MVSRADWLREAHARLLGAGIEDARLETRFLIRTLLEIQDTDLLARSDEPLSDREVCLLDEALSRRLNREPLSHILGTQPFWTLDLIVTPDVLTPRADTETIVEAILKTIPDRNAELRILDIGTGSGAILLALLSELKNAKGVGTDKSSEALQVARKNAERHDLADRTRFIETNWVEGVEGEFDIMVSNPPYIATAVIETLEPEVKDHEPHLALDGGDDGLEAYRVLFGDALSRLKSSGWLAFEIGYDQAESVSRLAAEAGLTDISVVQDLAGQDRCLVARKS